MTARRAALVANGAICVAFGPRIATAQTPPDLARATVPLQQLPIVARIDVPSSADWITFGNGSVWVVNYAPDRVSRVDVATNRLVATP